MFGDTNTNVDESHVNDSTNQDETNNAPITDDNPADGDGNEGDDPDPEPKRPTERTVPVSALIQERRRYQSTINEIRRELDQLKRGAKRASEDEPTTDYEKQRRTWQKQLGVTELQEQLAELSKHIEDLTGKVGNVDELSRSAQLAVRQYVGSVENYALNQYEDSLPVTKAQFDRLVAAEITPEEAEAIFEGDYTAINGAVKRVKQAFKQANPGTFRKGQEANKVKNLPKTPGTGGVAPKATKEEKPFTSLRDLHSDAWEDFNSIRQRQE